MSDFVASILLPGNVDMGFGTVIELYPKQCMHMYMYVYIYICLYVYTPASSNMHLGILNTYPHYSYIL